MALLQQGQQIDRFVIDKVIGKGAQGAVYLATDSKLERKVAIKTLNSGDADLHERLMAEAKIVSSLQNTSIVPVYDVGQFDQGLYIVFEYIKGGTLEDTLKNGALELDQASKLMTQLLEGIAAAHEKGIIHRDIKPSNILIGEDGRARITDFGIAMATSEVSKDNRMWGSLAYLAPEQLSNAEISTRSDVFSLGSVFYQMLTGEPAFQGDSATAIMYQVAHEALQPPSQKMNGGDPRYDQLVLRATSKDPQSRFADAQEFSAALKQLSTANTDGSATGKSGALDFLLRRIMRKPDFPALSRVIQEVNTIASSSDRRSANELSNAILKDPAITQKLLRLSNSSFYGQFGGNIHTISRAVIILGFNQVRSASLGLVLFENLKDAKDATVLAGTMLNSLFTSLTAQQLANEAGDADPEEAFICGMLQQLGRMLVIYYFPDEYSDIQVMMAQQDVSEELACGEILSVSYVQLARAVTKEWNFPKEIVSSLEPIPADSTIEAAQGHERLHQIARCAAEIVEICSRYKGEELEKNLEKVAKRYGKALNIKETAFKAILIEANEQLDKYLQTIKLPAAGKKALSRIKANIGIGPAVEEEESNDLPVESMRLTTEDAAITAIARTPQEQIDILMQGVNDVTQSIIDEVDLNTLLQSIMESMYRGLSLKKVLLCIYNPKAKRLTARYGFGDDIEHLINQLNIPMGGKDVFNLALSTQQDIVISDSQSEKIRNYIPPWFDKTFAAESFILFPLLVRKKPVGLFYLEMAAGADLQNNVLKALKALRNQAVMAIQNH